MGSGFQISRLNVLAAFSAASVLWAALQSPDLVVLAAAVSLLISLLTIFAGPRRVPKRDASGEDFGGEDYEIIEKISEGGMGEVFRARQVELGRLVAIKRMMPRQLSGEARARFQREARVLSGLTNPHTINVFDAGIQRGDTLFYVMELLDGLNLRQLVEREGTQPPARVISILRQATDSLHEAHDKGLVHRDIKPANIMVCRYGGDFDFVKVLDFGLVKAVESEFDQESSGAISQAGALPGTPAFLAPEAISGSGGTTPRADIYALGAIAHFLLTGAHLFEADGPLAMVSAQLNQQPPLASEKSPQAVPKELDELIARCLAKDPEERPQSASELLEILEDLGNRYPWTRAHAKGSWQEVPTTAVASHDPPSLPSDISALRRRG